MKGNLVLLVSTQAYIKSPKHADRVKSLYAAAPTFDDVNLSSSADDVNLSSSVEMKTMSTAHTAEE